MKVLFLLEQVEVLDLLEDPEEVNPGVGGTSYLILQLANRLNQLWSTNHTRSKEVSIGCWVKPSAVKTYRGMQVVNALDQNFSGAEFDIVIATGGALVALNANQISVKSRKLVAWIHHPYDWQKIKIAKKLKAQIVSVGAMQYLSNALIAGRHCHIENLFNSRAIQDSLDLQAGKSAKQTSDPTVINLGYMGALIPSKGFHRILEQWSTLRGIVEGLGKQIHLHVIGGSTLYSYQQSHPDLPCELKYGERLQQLIKSQNIDQRSLSFYGVLDKRRYQVMASCDVAIVNPDGYGEAFPATILEWLCLGVPTITSQRFGLSDVATRLPDLCIKNPKDIGKKLSSILSLNQQQQLSLQLKCLSVAEFYSAKQSLIVWQWSLLLDLLYERLLNQPVSSADDTRVFSEYLSMDEYPSQQMLRQLIRDYLDMQTIRFKRVVKALIATKRNN